jgi:hypothetical protein
LADRGRRLELGEKCAARRGRPWREGTCPAANLDRLCPRGIPQREAGRLARRRSWRTSVDHCRLARKEQPLIAAGWVLLFVLSTTTER